MMSAVGKLLGFVLASVAGLVLALGALLLAALVGVALVARKLLGRRLPSVPRRGPARGEVIDVEVREVASSRR